MRPFLGCLAWPRIESDEFLMSAGSFRPLGDAFRIAHKDMVDWLVQDFGLDMMDAYQLLSQVGKADVAQVVDPNYTILAKFPKKFLPPGRTYGGMHDKMKESRPESAVQKKG
jgi:amidase